MASIDCIQFDLLYRQYYPRVRHFVVRQGFCEDIAEDIVQESFVNAWEKRATLSSVESFGAWVRAISRNLCFLHMRSKRLVPMSVHTNAQETAESFELGDREEFANWVLEQCDGGWNYIEREKAMTALLKSIDVMPQGTRGKIGRLFYCEQKSVTQIKDMMNIKQNTILSHLRRFRRDLSKEMSRYHGDA